MTKNKLVHDESVRKVAEESLRNWHAISSAPMARQIAQTAKALGYFEIWEEIFADVPDFMPVKKELRMIFNK